MVYGLTEKLGPGAANNYTGDLAKYKPTVGNTAASKGITKQATDIFNKTKQQVVPQAQNFYKATNKALQGALGKGAEQLGNAAKTPPSFLGKTGGNIFSGIAKNLGKVAGWFAKGPTALKVAGAAVGGAAVLFALGAGDKKQDAQNPFAAGANPYGAAGGMYPGMNGMYPNTQIPGQSGIPGI